MKHWRKGIAVVLVMATAVMLVSCGGGLTPIGPETAQELAEEEFYLYETIDGEKQVFSRPVKEGKKWFQAVGMYNEDADYAWRGGELVSFRSIGYEDTLEKFCKSYEGCEVIVNYGNEITTSVYTVVDKKLYDKLKNEENAYYIEIRNIFVNDEYFPLYEYKEIENDIDYWEEIKNNLDTTKIETYYLKFTFGGPDIGIIDVVCGYNIEDEATIDYNINAIKSIKG